MDRSTTEEHLQLAESHVEAGDQLVSRQRQLVSELRKHGLDTTIAVELLKSFEKAQAMHVADRDRLRKEMSRSNTWVPI
jgi:hypothetical protein